MKRPIICLWPCFVPVILLIVLMVFCFIPTWLALQIPYTSAFLPNYILLVVLLFRLWKDRWPWRLSRLVWNFQTVSTPNAVLHFDPRLEGRWDFALLLKRIESVVDDLAFWFDFSLRRRPVVFLFFSRREIGQILGREMGGFALRWPNAIAIANDSNVEEIIRHEIAHLFAFRWNNKAPPLLGEGLATWSQGTYWGKPIDSAARFVSHRYLSLHQLLKPSFFFSPEYQDACYRLAGSFSGFLIRRYGWKKYRQCYRTAGIGYLRRKFKRAFGVSLDEAEMKWQRALAIDESPPMKVLRKKLERDLTFSF